MSRPSILIVEDETITAMALRATLEAMGYAVPATVPTGEEAIERARALRPDAVLMDIRLKGRIDGIAAAETIRNEVGSPIVYLTAYSDPETLRRARVTEPYGYIVKPYNENELRAVIEIAVHKGAMERARRAQTEAIGSDVFQQIIDANPAAIYLKRTDGRLLFANERFATLFGLPREGAQGIDDSAILPQTLAEGDAKALRESAVTSARETVQLASGERTFQVVRMPLTRGDGTIYGVCTILTESDSTPQAVGLLGLALQRTTGEPTLGAAAALASQHEALSGEARALMTSVRATLAKLVAPMRRAPASEHTAEVDVGALAREAMAKLQSNARSRVEFHVEPGLHASADPLLLRVVLESLIENAIKFSGDRPHPRIEVGRGPAMPGETVIYVRDNGIGFEREAADRLFQPYTRLKSAAPYPGVGLGLSAVRNYIAAHGGRVWAEGEPDVGATFYFSLPEA